MRGVVDNVALPAPDAAASAAYVQRYLDFFGAVTPKPTLQPGPRVCAVRAWCVFRYVIRSNAALTLSDVKHLCDLYLVCA